MIRAVLFDLDGVLVDSYEVWFQAMNAVAQELACPPISREVFADSWGQGIEQDVECFFPGRTIPELEERYERAYPRHLEHLRVDPDAAGLLATLRERGLGTALITNTPGGLARSVLEFAGLTLDAVVGGTDVPRCKPAPDMVLRACALLEVSPEAAVVVGDTAYDRDAAAAAGVEFIGVRCEGAQRVEVLGAVVERLSA